MNNRIKRIIVILNFILVLIVTFFSTIREENYKKMDYFYLKLAPVDPRSLMQGDYMILNYEITEEAMKKMYDEEEDRIKNRAYIVAKIDENKVAQFVDIVNEPFDNSDYIFIAFKISSFYNIKINADSFFFQEGDSKLYENAKFSKVVLVKNNLRLIDLVEKLD